MMMICKRTLFIIFCFTIIFSESFAQSKSNTFRSYKNAVYFEIGGPTLAYAFGYERTWYKNNWFSAMSSAGFSYIPDGITMGYLEPGVLFRHKNIALELGVALMSYKERANHGWSYSTSDGSGDAKMLTLTPRLGVRFFTKNQRFHFRTGITPVKEIWNNNFISFKEDRKIFFWLNIFTLGYRF